MRRLGATKNLDIFFGGSSLGQRWVNVVLGQRSAAMGGQE